MLLFQFAGVAEKWLSDNNWAHFRSWARHPDAEAVIAELEDTKSLTPGLNWYRANVPPESWVAPPLALPAVQAPTMGIWSSGDMALTETQMTDSAENVAGPWRYERVDGPGHWMQLVGSRRHQPASTGLPPPVRSQDKQKWTTGALPRHRRMSASYARFERNSAGKRSDHAQRLRLVCGQREYARSAYLYVSHDGRLACPDGARTIVMRFGLRR